MVPAVLAIASLLVPAVAKAPTASLHLKRHHRPGAPVFIVLQNVSDETLRFSTPWTISETKTGQISATYHWKKGERTLAPDQTAIWEWDQREGAHSTAPAPPEEAERVGPGGYVVTIETAGRTFTRRFHIGRFFTVGFEGRDATVTVFVNERRQIDRMKAEAEAALEDKRFIVSGIVRGEKKFNEPWSYSMGPGSIVLAEVFVEVCDASPGYVERHQEDWLGKRWCPWSSYVLKTGR